MKPLPINQKHALFHAFLKGTDFKEKIEKMKEENRRSLISLILKNMGKLIAAIKQQHVRTMGVGGQFTWSAFTRHKDEKDLCQNKETYVKAVNERDAILGHRVRNNPLVGIPLILVVLPCYTTC